MLNQFIQICIQIRNVGWVAVGCLIDGLIDVVGGFFRLTLRPMHRYLTLQQPQRYRDTSEMAWRLGHRDRLLCLQTSDLPRTGELWLQG